MDASDFHPQNAPGRLARTAEGLTAFHPHPLPPNWEMPHEFWPLTRDA